MLATDSNNQVAQKALKKIGFAQVSNFLIMECKGFQIEKIKNSSGHRKAMQRKYGSSSQTRTYSQNPQISTQSCLRGQRWKNKTSLNSSQIKKAIIHESNDAINGLVLIDETIKNVWQEKPFQTCYIDGDHQSVTDMIRFFKTCSCQQEIANVYAFACNILIISAALTETGFNSEEPTTELIYEKKLNR